MKRTKEATRLSKFWKQSDAHRLDCFGSYLILEQTTEGLSQCVDALLLNGATMGKKKTELLHLMFFFECGLKVLCFGIRCNVEPEAKMDEKL